MIKVMIISLVFLQRAASRSTASPPCETMLDLAIKTGAPLVRRIEGSPSHNCLQVPLQLEAALTLNGSLFQLFAQVDRMCVGSAV